MREAYEKAGLEKNIFHSKKLENITEKLKELNVNPDKLSKDDREDYNIYLEQYARTGKYQEEIIRLGLKTVDASDIAKISEIIKFFIPTVKFSDLEKILPEDKKQIISEKISNAFNEEMIKYFGKKNWEKFTTEEQEKFISTIPKQDWEVNIEAISSEEIAKIFLKNGTEITDELLESITKRLNELEFETDNVQNLEEMKNFLELTLKKEEKKKIVGTLDDILEGKFLHFFLKDGSEGVIKITSTDTGIAWKIISVEHDKGMQSWHEVDENLIHNSSYQEFSEIFSNKLKASKECKILNKKPENSEYDYYDEQDNYLVTRDGLRERIDGLDNKNKTKGFEEGMMLSVTTEHGLEYVQVEVIDDNSRMLRLRLIDNKTIDISWNNFVKQIFERNMNIRRLGKITNISEFAQNIAFGEGTPFTGNELKPIKGITTKDTKLLTEATDEQ